MSKHGINNNRLIFGICICFLGLVCKSKKNVPLDSEGILIETLSLTCMNHSLFESEPARKIKQKINNEDKNENQIFPIEETENERTGACLCVGLFVYFSVRLYRELTT